MSRKELLEFIKDFMAMVGEAPTQEQLRPLLEVVEREVRLLRQEEYNYLLSLLGQEVDIQEPWSGASLEDIWEKNTEDLVFGLNRDIVKGALAGAGALVIVNMMRKRFNTEHKQTKAVVRTEGTRVFNEQRIQKARTSQYRFLASPSERTCAVCSSLDLKVFDVADRVVGVNFPPLHPHCRCTVVPVVDGQSIEDARWVEKGFNYDAWKLWNSKYQN